MKFEKLGNITSNLDGKRIPLNSQQRAEKSIEKLYPYIGANNIIDYIDEYIFDEKILCLAEDGGSWGAKQICANIYNEKCWVNNHAHVLKENGKANLEYLRYFLNEADLNKYITGTTRGKLTKSALNSIEVPLPSISTQLHIANILSKAESLIAQRKESIRLLDDYLKSVFLEMFGDPLENLNKFEIKTLKDFYINPKEGTKCGPFGSALKKHEYTSSGIPVWNMDNISIDGNFVSDINLFITEEKYSQLSAYSTFDGDIIISRAGTVGKMCVLQSGFAKSIISTNLIRVRLNTNLLLPIHFVSLMKYCKNRMARLRTGSDDTFTHMNTGILDGLKFPVPPLKLQTKFAQIVEKVEALKAQYQQSLQEFENLYGSLSQKAFKGELSIKDESLLMAAEPETKYGEK